ncbi:unnamed protein product [Sphagnum balticum]
MSFVLPPAEMLRVNPQLATEFDYDKDIFHDYVESFTAQHLLGNSCHYSVQHNSPRRRCNISPRRSKWVRQNLCI